MEYVLLGLILLAVPFVLPLALWGALYRTRTRLAMLEETVSEQKEALARLSAQLAQLRSTPSGRSCIDFARRHVFPPRESRHSAAQRPNSITRVLSGLSDSENSSVARQSG